MAEMDDQELFSSATTDDPTPETTEQPVAQQEAPPSQEGRQRDEHGRFVPKQAEPAPAPEQVAEQPQAEDDGGKIPPWRLREMREERDAANQRYLETQRQLEEMRRQMPRPEPKPAPDMYENPDGFVGHHIQQGLSPIEQRLQAAEQRLQMQLEENSRRDAFREHGQDTVRAAYEWLGKGIQSRDPDVVHVYNQVMQSAHPYDAAVQMYKRASVMQQISQVGDIDKWVIQRAAELNGQGQAQPQQQSRQQPGQPQGGATRLPPSLRSVPAARGAAEEDNDMSDAALFRHATR